MKDRFGVKNMNEITRAILFGVMIGSSITNIIFVIINIINNRKN